MPEAGVSTETHHFDLKSAPPDGFVDLRQLSYQEMLVRRDKGSIASMESTQTNRRQRRGSEKPQTSKMVLESLQTWERHYTFSLCIVDHNLTIDGEKIDFKNPKSFDKLNPIIASEIEILVDELNNGEDDDFFEDFPKPASSSSTAEQELET